jgi:dethiobiotin synthetase
VRDVLVTGTDTGIGKTVVSAALVKSLRARGVRAVGFKPVETGVEPGTAADSELLAQASGEHVRAATPLVQLPEALAPAVAAERAGISVNPDEIEARIRQLRDDGYTVIVEGAGGAMVPLSWGGAQAERPFYTVLDLAEACGLEAIVVGRAGLGTLNHVALTVTMLQQRGVEVRGVVLNRRADPPDLAELTNPTAMARMIPGIPVVLLADETGGNPIDAAIAVVGRLI